MPRILILVVFLGLSLFVPLLAQAQTTRLPQLGEASGGLLTPGEELELGRSLLREVRRVMPLQTDPQVIFYMEVLGQRLLSNTLDTHSPFYFLPIANPQINAFAMPGGIIGVYSGLILAARDEAELAAVLAHEIAHVTQRHIARMYARSRDVNYVTGLAILAGILAASIDPQLAQAAIAGGIAGQMQSRLNFSRVHEAEADRVGIQILAETNLDPHAMADFFERLQALTRGAQDNIPDYLRTHPVTLERISDARGRATTLTGEFQREITGEFAWIQARLRALTDPQRSLQHHAARGDQATPVQHYEAFVAHLANQRPEQAAQHLQQIPANQAPSLLLDLAGIELAQARQAYSEALADLEVLNSLYPQHPLIQRIEAQIRHYAGEHREAVRLIDRLLRQPTTPDPELLRLKADAAAGAGLRAISQEAMAEYFFHRGQYSEAIRHFDQALAATGATTRDIERIEFKRDSAKQVAEDQEQQRQ